MDSTTTELEHVTEETEDSPELTLPSGGDHTLFPISSVPTTVTSTGADILLQVRILIRVVLSVMLHTSYLCF